MLFSLSQRKKKAKQQTPTEDSPAATFIIIKYFPYFFPRWKTLESQASRQLFTLKMYLCTYNILVIQLSPNWILHFLETHSWVNAYLFSDSFFFSLTKDENQDTREDGCNEKKRGRNKIKFEVISSFGWISFFPTFIYHFHLTRL